MGVPRARRRQDPEIDVRQHDSVAYELREREAVRFYGSNLADAERLAFEAPDPFERWARERERRVDRAVAVRYVAP